MAKIKVDNEYFYQHDPKEHYVNDARIPAGCKILHFRGVYIPEIHGSRFWRGAGTNGNTNEVPVHYIANPGGLRRAIAFCAEHVKLAKPYNQPSIPRKEYTVKLDGRSIEVYALSTYTAIGNALLILLGEGKQVQRATAISAENERATYINVSADKSGKLTYERKD